MIQIGVFEGADLVWCLQNILTHPDSRVVAVDSWAPSHKVDQARVSEIEARARHNLSPWAPKVDIRKGDSAHVLKVPNISKDLLGTFDLCVIDGDHTAGPVRNDAANCFHLLKSGGWFVFDDVRVFARKNRSVQEGIEMFLAGEHGPDVKFEWAHRHCDCYRKL